MGLRIIYGRAGTGKSHLCMNEIKQELERDSIHPLILIVPEQFTLQAEINLMRRVGTGGIMRAQVLSFQRLSYRVFNEVGGMTRRHINASGKCMLLQRIIEAHKDQFKVFSKAVRQPGFVNTLADTIKELKRYHIVPLALGEMAEQIQGDSLLKDKLSEIAMIYQAFESVLHERYMDTEDDLTELVKRLDDSVQFDGAEVWMDGFSGFTPQEYNILVKLAKKVRRVSVCLCTDHLGDRGSEDGTDVFSPSRKTAHQLMHRVATENIVQEPVVVCGEDKDAGASGRFRQSTALYHLEREFFAHPYHPYSNKTEDLSIFSAASIYSEVEHVARDILRLCRDQKMRFKDIAVVTRDLEVYGKLVHVVFTQYGIPCFIDKKKDILCHPLLQLVASALRIFTDNWSYEAVFSYLKSGLTNMDRMEVDVLENYVLACGIRGSRWTSEDDWQYIYRSSIEKGEVHEEDTKRLERINHTKRAVVSPLLQFRMKTKGKRTGTEFCKAMYEFLCEIGIPERIEERIETFRQSGELNLANEYSQVWNILMEVLDQVVEVMGEERIGLERFTAMLEAGLGQYQIGLIPPALDQVLVGSVERSKSHAIQALYILGVNDGIFPAAQNDEGILSDKDRDTLRVLGMELAGTTRTQAFEEQYLIYSVLTTPSLYLHISFPIADHEGRTMRPSMILSRLRKIFPKLLEKSDISVSQSAVSELELISSPVPTFDWLLTMLRRKQDGFEVDQKWKEVYEWFLNEAHWRDRCSAAVSGLSYTNQAAWISKDQAMKLYGSPMRSSVSRLENYRACPFSYYIQYGLKAKERRMFRVEAPDMGAFMHQAIDRFSKQLSEKGLSWRSLQKEWCIKEVSTIVEDILEQIPGSVFNSTHRYRHLCNRLKKIIGRAVWLIAEHIRRGSFEPMGYELGFGEDEGFPPLTIQLPSGESICLHGRIDRMDGFETQEGTYLRIIDYKSGSKAFKLSEVYYGLQIQLLVYLDAALQAVGDEKQVLPAGVLYFKIDDPMIKGDRTLTEEEIEKSVIKQLKMRGLVLADVKVVKEMDHQIEGDSLIIPARINKGDVLGRSSAATIAQFEMIRRHVRGMLVKIAAEITSGAIPVRPYKIKSTTPCTYCNYSAICQFDPLMKDNVYQGLSELKDEEVWHRLRDLEDSTS